MYASLLFCFYLFAFATVAYPSNVNDLRHNPKTTMKSQARNNWTPSSAADTANIYVCEHINWGGRCSNISYSLGSGQCTPLDGTSSSIRPDSGLSCTFYKNAICRTIDGSEMLKLTSTGSADLTQEPGGWNDAARGFQCFRVI